MLNQIGIILMASGVSKRFGQNKLLADVNGKCLFEWAVASTNLQHVSRLALTRTKEIQHLCEDKGIDCICHDLPNRNEAILLGMNKMKKMDAVVFVPCDQPLLSQTSLKKMIALASDSKIVRLGFKGVVGSPILFGKAFFQELMELPEKKGGSYVARVHDDQVLIVEAENEWELFDVDIPEDIEQIKIYMKQR